LSALVLESRVVAVRLGLRVATAPVVKLALARPRLTVW
jgi:hypothetical protein